MPADPLLLWIAAVVGLAGLCLIVLGLRRRTIAHHPICRQCRFDLSGVALPPIGDAAVRCPECGSDLRAKHAIRPTLTRRRPITLAFGILLLVVAGSSGVYQNRMAFTRLLQRHKPVAWLLADLESERWTRLNAAAAELSRRIGDGWIASDAQVAAITDSILARQADRTRTWSITAGILIELWHRQGRIDEPRLRSYLANVGTVSIGSPARARADGVVSVSFTAFTDRCGRVAPPVLMRCERLEINGVVLALNRDLVTFNPSENLRHGGGYSKRIGLSPGPATIRAVVTLHERTSKGIGPVVRRFELEHEFELVGPDEILVNIRESPELDSAVRAAFRKVTAAVEDPAKGLTQVRLDFELGPTPIHIFQRVIATWADADGKQRSTDLGAIIVSPNMGDQTLGFGGTLKGQITGSLAILLIPDIPTAERTAGVEVIYGGSIDFGEVPTAVAEELWETERLPSPPTRR